MDISINDLVTFTQFVHAVKQLPKNCIVTDILPYKQGDANIIFCLSQDPYTLMLSAEFVVTHNFWRTNNV